MVWPSTPATTYRNYRVWDSALARVRYRLFGIDAFEALFARRGFADAEPARHESLELIGRTFIAGYNSAVRSADPIAILNDWDTIPHQLRGFAFEGAAMGFAMLDLVSPRRSQWFARFLTGVADPHTYMAHVGAGCALARTSPALIWRPGKLDPPRRLLMFDGYGFHAGYFHNRESFDLQRLRNALVGYTRNVFDRGLGRALWFVKGARVNAVVAAVSDFPEQRRADLWSGIRLAAHAGGASADGLKALTAASGSRRACLGQGVAFAAKARERAGNPAPHTELACQIICGIAAASAAAITDRPKSSAGHNDRREAYERWRAEIRRALEAR
jgi:enediyne biosynthesis protein E3